MSDRSYFLRTQLPTALMSMVILFGQSQIPNDRKVEAAEPSIMEQWPQWRGPLGTGAAPTANPPVRWSESDGVRWKVKLPGSGTATPIIWGNRVFIQTAIPKSESTFVANAAPATPKASPVASPASSKARSTAIAMLEQLDENSDGKIEPSEIPDGLRGRLYLRLLKRHNLDPEKSYARKELQQIIGSALDRAQRSPAGGGGGRSAAPSEPFQFVLLCLDRRTGKTIWQQVVREEQPHEGHHRDHGFASYSPVTDGEHVVAYFGSRGVHCFDMDGTRKWDKDFGDMRIAAGFGEGSSPTIHGKTVVVNWDHEGESFIVALDKLTGSVLWQRPRDERTSWSTPLVVEHDGSMQVVTAASRRIRSYSLDSGQLLWECSGLTSNVIPSPVAGKGVVYATSGYRGSALMAIRLGGTGDLTGTDAVAWTHGRGTPYVPSPLLYDERLYFFGGNNAVLTCLDAKSGKAVIASQRIGALQGVYASPIGAAGNVYLIGRNGATVVIKSSDQLEVLATNKLDERIDSSPAAVGNELFLRGHVYLYCIAAD